MELTKDPKVESGRELLLACYTLHVYLCMHVCGVHKNSSNWVSYMSTQI